MQCQQIDQMAATPNTIFLALEITLGVATGQFLPWGLCMGAYGELSHYWAIKISQHKQQSQRQSQPDSLSTYCLKRRDKKAQWCHFPEGNTTKFNRSGHLKCTSAHAAHCCTWKQPRMLQMWRTDDCLPSAQPSDLRQKIMQKIFWNIKCSLNTSTSSCFLLLWQDRCDSKINCSSHTCLQNTAFT